MEQSRVLFVTQKEKRRRLISRSAIITYGVIGILIAVAVTGFFALRRELWQIRTIEISGLKTLQESEVAFAARESFAGVRFGLFPLNSFFLVSSGEVKKTLQKTFPQIREISVKKEFPETLKIAIAERTLFAIVCGTASGETDSPPCFFIDEDGVLYEKAPYPRGSLILKIEYDTAGARPGEALIAKEVMEKMGYMRRALDERFNIEVASFIFIPKLENEIRLKTREGFSLIVNRNDNFENVLKVLKMILDDEIKEKRGVLDYIDLRFGNKVFYKMKS